MKHRDIINQIFPKKEGIFLATLDDIAQELGISKGTVSKALNGAKDVSRKMQQAVLEKAVELVLKGEIYDSKSVTAILMLERSRKEK